MSILSMICPCMLGQTISPCEATKRSPSHCIHAWYPLTNTYQLYLVFIVSYFKCWESEVIHLHSKVRTIGTTPVKAPFDCCVVCSAPMRSTIQCWNYFRARQYQKTRSLQCDNTVWELCPLCFVFFHMILWTHCIFMIVYVFHFCRNILEAC